MWYHHVTPHLARLREGTHMVHFIHDRIVRFLVNRHVHASLTLALARTRRAARVRGDFSPKRAEGSRVALDPVYELAFGFEVI